jgi:Lrp/AsnC family transcriptional regulator for asnA, asnC and gidA
VKKNNLELEEDFKEQAVQIDDLDRKILKLITNNARVPFLEVARECGVSGAAIHQRVQRLISMGVVTGSEFIVSPSRMGYNTTAFMGIYLEKTSFDKKVLKQLKDIPEVVECHTTGQYAIFIKIQTKTNKHLMKIIDTDLQAIDGIARTETFISLEQDFKRQIPIK